jgi:hypothetical protein
MQTRSVFSVVSQYFWLIAIVVTCVNGAIWWRRAQPKIAERPELEQGYRRLIRGWLIYGNIPWIVMGIGILYGGVSGVFMYFSAANGPYVIAWYVSVVVLWILTAAWLFFMRGAEQLIEHPGLLNLPSQNPRVVKAFFLLSLAGGIIALSMMVLGKVPTITP